MDILVIPDTQVKKGVDVSYLVSIAKYAAQEKPAYIIHLGDHHDMPSLSYYDKGKKSHEVYNYIDDIESGNEATDLFFKALDLYWRGHKKKCKKIKLRGNHEDRINRAREYGDATLCAMIRRFKIDDSRWNRVIPFNQPLKIGGIFFSHYFPNDNSGKPIGTARQLLNKRSNSVVAGHQQGFDYAEQLTMDGKTLHALIAGSCYLHDENYKGPQCNHHFRGIVMLRNVRDGMYDIERYSLDRLMKDFKC